MSSRNLRIQMVMEGLDKISGPLRRVAESSTGAGRKLAATRAELDKLKKTEASIGAFRTLKRDLKSTETEMAAANRKVAQLAQTMRATDAPTKKMAQEFERAKRAAAQLKNEHGQQSAKLQQLRTKLSEAGIRTSQLSNHERDLRANLARTTEQLEKQKRALDRTNRAKERSEKLSDVSGKLAGGGASALAGGAAMLAPLVGATKQAMTFEGVMADVRKVVEFEKPEQFQKMQQDLVDLSTRVPMAVEGLGEIAAAAGRSGIAREEIMAFTEDAAKMGIAFDITAEQAGGMMSKWRAAFGMGQKDVVGLADSVNALTNKYGGSAEAVSEIITRIGPLGKVAGVAAPQIAAIGQLMNRQGVEAEIAATGTKNMMLALTKGASATKAQGKAFAALGLDSVEVAKRMQTDAGGAITDVMERLAKLDAHEQAGMLTQLFGSESVAAIAPMLTNLDQLKTNFKLVGDASQTADSMNKEFLARIATSEGALGLAKNAAAGLNITLGQAMLPVVTAVSGKILTLANWLRKFATDNPKTAKAIMVVVGVLGTLLVVLGGLALAMAATTAAGAALGVALWPILAIVAAIAVLAGLGYAIYANWGSISAFFTGLWETMKSLFVDAIATLAGVIMGFAPVALFRLGFDAVLTFLRGLATQFQTIGGQILDGLIAGIKNKLAAVKETIGNVAGAVTGIFKKKMDINSPSRVFAGFGGFVMAGLSQGIAANAAEPIQRIAQISDQMSQAFALGNAAGGAPIMPPTAGGATPGANGAGAGPPAAAPDSYTINIYADGGDARSIEDAVRRAIEQIEREKRGRGFGDF